MSVTTKSRLLCPECTELRQVSNVNGSIELECGHSRPELLPAKGVSFEHLGTRAGARWFPPNRSDELTANRAWIDAF